MKTLFVIAVSLICYWWCSGQDVKITDGNSLLERCELVLKQNPNGEEGLLVMHLAAYLSGFTDGVIASAGLQGQEVPYNIPGNVSLLQQVRIIKKWLEDHPKDLNKDPRLLIWTALRDAYPLKAQ